MESSVQVNVDMKRFIIDAIKGCDCMGCYSESKYVRFCGNQWNPDWEWKRNELETLGQQELFNIYVEVTGQYDVDLRESVKDYEDAKGYHVKGGKENVRN